MAHTTNADGTLATVSADPPGGAAGGVLAGTYPDPTFAADMATQAELDAINTALDARIDTLEATSLAKPGASQVGVAAFATDRTPSATRPVLVVANVRIGNDKNEDGTVEARVGPNAVPTQVTAFARHIYNDANASASDNTIIVPLMFMVPANHVYRIVTTTTVGTPFFALESVREWVL